MQRKHRTGFQRTDDVLSKIIRRESFTYMCIGSGICSLASVTVQTGLITAVCALVDLVLFLATVSDY